MYHINDNVNRYKRCYLTSDDTKSAAEKPTTASPSLSARFGILGYFYFNAFKVCLLSFELKTQFFKFCRIYNSHKY